jgi:uncharacterized membrane protein YccC
MKRIAAVAVGTVAGVALAGPVVAFSVWLPPPLRNQYVVLGVAALVVALTLRVAWRWSEPRSD